MRPHLFYKPFERRNAWSPGLKVGHSLIVLRFTSDYDARHGKWSSSQEPFVRSKAGLSWSLPVISSIPSPEWGLLRKEVGRWHLMGQIDSGSRRKHPPNSPDPGFLQIPLSSIPMDSSHPFRGTGDPGHHKGELNARQQKGSFILIWVTF